MVLVGPQTLHIARDLKELLKEPLLGACSFKI